MFLFYFSIILTILSNSVYHIVQKLTPGNANPALALTATYLTAALASMGLLAVYRPEGGLAHSLRQLNWTSFALGIAIIGLELGFLLAYRAGWNISLAGIVSNTTVGLLLLPVGLLLFKEKISPVNVIGILLCIGGLVLVNRK